MNRLTFYFFAAAIFLFSCKKEKAEFETEARNFLSQNKTEEAIQILNSAIEAYQNDANLYNIRGVAFYQLGEFSKAITDFEISIQLDSSNYRPFYNMGNCFFEMSNFRNAIASYSKANELQPDVTDIFINRANAYFELNEFKNAISDFNMALELDPQSYLASFNLAKTYIETDSVNAAIPLLEKCTRINPKAGESFYFLAYAKYILDESEDYCGQYQMSLALGYEPQSQILEKVCRGEKNKSQKSDDK